jgi:1,4-dihydroxy-2-naphthoate octaprenyltransferase
MPIKKIKKNIKEAKSFDWLAMLILFSFALISISILVNHLDEYNDELDAELRGMQAETFLKNNK